MMRATRFPPFTSPAVRRLAVTTRGIWYSHGLDPKICSTSGVRVLALVGLLVGSLVLALQSGPVAWPPSDVPSTVVWTTPRLPLNTALGLDSAPILHHTGAPRVAVAVGRIALPNNSHTQGEDGLDDGDNPSCPAMSTAGTRFLMLAPAVRDANGLKHACLWPFRYLTRPQLLTRC
jgi:hypothetical protein